MHTERDSHEKNDPPSAGGQPETTRPAALKPRSYKPRGFRRTGKRCPKCGGPISHGRPGNPAWRKGEPPCMKPTALAQQAANDDARRRIERTRARHEAWERIARLKAANARAAAAATLTAPAAPAHS